VRLPIDPCLPVLLIERGGIFVLEGGKQRVEQRAPVAGQRRLRVADPLATLALAYGAALDARPPLPSESPERWTVVGLGWPPLTFRRCCVNPSNP
jgi:hypothetical protein